MSEKPKRRLAGGWWRRSLAGIVDLLLVCALVTAAAYFLYEPTGGRVRMQQPLWSTGECVHQTGAPKGLPTMGIRADYSETCRLKVFGREVDRAVTITRQDVHDSGHVTASTKQWVRIPVDTHGRQVPVYYLDWIVGSALVLMLAVCEGLSGRTPGKLLFGLRVADGRGRTPGLGRALTRNLLCWGSWALSAMVSPLVTVGVNLGLGGFWPLTWGLYGVSLAWFLLALLSWLFMRPDPFWDRAAGVSVVRAGRG